MTIRMSATVGGFLATASNPWSVTLQFLATVDLTSTELLAAANDIMTALAADSTFKSGLGTNRNVQSVRLAMHNPSTGPETSAAVSTGSPVAGTATASLAVPQAACVATLRTQTPGRSYRGRIYWPLLTSTVDGTVSSGNKTTINNAVQALVADIETQVALNGSNLAWVVWSRALGIGTPITGVSIGSRCDTQRRRNDGPDTYTNFPVT